MRKPVLFTIVMCTMVMLVGGLVWAEKDITKEIKVKSINSMDTYKKKDKSQTEERYWLKMVVTLTNSSDTNVKLRDVIYHLTFKADKDLYVGMSEKIKDAVIPRNRGRDYPGELELELNFDAGPADETTFDHLMDIFGMVANPSKKPFTMYLEAKGKLGVQQDDSGWVYQDYEAELVFKPKGKSKVLFK